MTKPVPGYEGYYDVSTDGRVFSIERVVHRKSGLPMYVQGKELRQSIREGYPVVGLTVCGKCRVVCVHKLMAMAFLSKPECTRAEVDHINGDRLDNRIENLRWVDAPVNRMNCGVPRNNTSGVRGVGWCKQTKKWSAYIKAKGKNIRLGRYEQFHDAVAAREGAEAEFWKEVECDTK